MTGPSHVSLTFHDCQPALADFRRDVLDGLGRTRKALAAKYFYDEYGSLLFERICDTEEYYPTRTEAGILQAHATEIAETVGADCALIEYGSGSSRKTPLLLDALGQPAAYVPIDICKEQLLLSAARLAASRPGLEVVAICADYTQLQQLPAAAGLQDARRVIFFPGSTIGNCTPAQAAHLLRSAAGLLGAGGGMLIGVDLKKDPRVLHAAYNDAQGVTEAFNLNLLTRINRELHANFDVTAFRHCAFYHEEHGRVEMHLQSLAAQMITVGGATFPFLEGETIHTENSYKYGIREFQELAASAGFVPARVWTDPERLFSLHYLTVH
ncbi:MAG: L-histidine N(alpha)-methyltransferase [Pseudomonadota bacterium]